MKDHLGSSTSFHWTAYEYGQPICTSKPYGFARRFATYKRAHLLFTDLERLSKIVNNPDYPVQFLFAGKAHPNDGAGQGLIKKIVEISRRPEFLGKIIFLENYDMQLARRFVSGVDICMNTPTRPLEASATLSFQAASSLPLHNHWLPIL